jgi:hypothetical protein
MAGSIRIKKPAAYTRRVHTASVCFGALEEPQNRKVSDAALGGRGGEGGGGEGEGGG